MNEHDSWDAKHRAQRRTTASEPDAFVVRALDRLGRGDGRRALDLAAGRGRHALELARRGYAVTAVDSSAEALEQLAAHARSEDLRVARRRRDLESEAWSKGLSPVDLIVVVNYLDRALFAQLPALLRPGGRVLVTTYTKDRAGDHPSERWCLERGELAGFFSAAQLELQEEQNGRASVLALFWDSGV